ncbi:hypothetical protein DS745_21580 [Anaerobacillus alkaliphilus]|uniref:XRE family transcriptional regulator n=1 Tax=Anaerobacillus alkaliphilus TaxID=1548597 RepID=A0A4Q0VLJ6_9BACI|nr:hypothetical protein [Anaerobacillus alkaliphilus]RXI96317.1 hypothetical protein DS745_21580 [Anaerobacillus alkaliphilus]
MTVEEQKELFLKLLGESLQRKRSLTGKIQIDLVEDAINYKHYGKIEKGNVDARIWTLFCISEALDTSLPSILEEVIKEYKAILASKEDKQ